MFSLDFLHFSVPTNKINHLHKIFKWQGFSFYEPRKKNHPIEITLQNLFMIRRVVSWFWRVMITINDQWLGFISRALWRAWRNLSPIPQQGECPNQMFNIRGITSWRICVFSSLHIPCTMWALWNASVISVLTSSWYFSISSRCSIFSFSICSDKDWDLSLSDFRSSVKVLSFSAAEEH